MFELLIVLVFLWLMFEVFKLCFKITWGVVKLIAGILAVLALPLLIVGILFWSGVALVLPIVVLCVAFGLLKACI